MAILQGGFEDNENSENAMYREEIAKNIVMCWFG